MQSAVLGMSDSEERKNRQRENGSVYQLTIHLFAPQGQNMQNNVTFKFKSLLLTKIQLEG